MSDRKRRRSAGSTAKAYESTKGRTKEAKVESEVTISFTLLWYNYFCPNGEEYALQSL